MEFSRQVYWSGYPFPSPGNLPDPGIEPRSPTLQVDSLPSEPRGKTGKFSLRASAIKVGKTWWQFQIQPPQLSTFFFTEVFWVPSFFVLMTHPSFCCFLILFCCLKLIIIARQSAPLFEKLHLGNVPITLPSRRELLQLHQLVQRLCPSSTLQTQTKASLFLLFVLLQNGNIYMEMGFSSIL